MTAPRTHTGPGFYAAYYGSNGNGGWVLRGMEIAATFDGTTPAPAGDQISITLPAPFTFSDGTTTKSYAASGTAASVTLPSDAIRVPVGTAPGTYTIIVEYWGATHSVTMTVIEGGNVYAWGLNSNGQANGSGPGTLTAPFMWGYSQDRQDGTDVGYSTYSGITGGNAAFAAYSDIYDQVATTGDNRGIWRRRFDSESLVTNNKGQASNAVFFWGDDGKLYAWGDNKADKFSLGDGTPVDGTKSYSSPVAVGTKILEANPGKTIKSVYLGTDTDRVTYLLSDGTVWHSGNNNRGAAMGLNLPYADNFGQFLAGQTFKSDGTPLTNIVSVASAKESTIYLDDSGRVWGSGQNNNATRHLAGAPVGAVQSAVQLNTPDSKPVSKIWAAGENLIMQTTDGVCYIFGDNTSGLGSCGTPGRVGGSEVIVPDGKTIADIAIAPNSALYRMTDGTVYFCGNNSASGAGKTATGTDRAMTQVPLTGTAIDIAVTYTNSYAAIVK